MSGEVEKGFVRNTMATVQIKWSLSEKSKTRKIRFLGASIVLQWFNSARPLNGSQANRMKIVRKETYGRESTSSAKLKAKDDTSLLTFHEVHAKTKQEKCKLLEKEYIKSPTIE